jgi:hypothetical protein
LNTNTTRASSFPKHEPVKPGGEIVRWRVWIPVGNSDTFENAQEVLREAGKEDEAARLDGVSWHGLRHPWVSRLTMAGVDPRTLQTLGNWRSLSMVERYGHPSPDLLRSAVEKLVSPSTTSGVPVAAEGPAPGLELDSNLTRPQDEALRAP